ncbi:MAG: hypothetical protein OXC92_07005 [Flavobacteriaceae bacterium]|nr:hypothetical protein [Flavobacteriaceae bacterium]
MKLKKMKLLRLIFLSVLLSACSKGDKGDDGSENEFGFSVIEVDKEFGSNYCSGLDNCDNEKTVSDSYKAIGKFEHFGDVRFDIWVGRLNGYKYDIEDVKKQVNQAFVDVFKVIEKSDIAYRIYSDGEFGTIKIQLYDVESVDEENLIERYVVDNRVWVSFGFSDVDCNEKGCWSGSIWIVYDDGELNLEESF